jgi:methyl-accepting chemotaxis protein
MDAIHTRILDALGQMQFQDISRQQIEQVKSAFAQFAENSDWSAIEGMIDELKQGYVMQAQHETHGKVTGERIESEDRPAIELF